MPSLVGATLRHPLHVRGAALRRPQLDHRLRAAAAHPRRRRWPGRSATRARRSASCWSSRRSPASAAATSPARWRTSPSSTRSARRAGRSASTPPAATSAPPSCSSSCPLVIVGRRRHRASAAAGLDVRPARPRSRPSGAWRVMDNLTGAKADCRSFAAAPRNRHTWIMSFLYIGTFGSFIGYAGAFPMLIKTQFPDGRHRSAIALPRRAGRLAGPPARRLARRPVRRRPGDPRVASRVHGRSVPVGADPGACSGTASRSSSARSCCCSPPPASATARPTG